MTSSSASERHDEPPQGLTSLYALAIVARHHGFQLSPIQLARDNALESGEPSIKRLAKIAADNGLQARPVRMTWKQLFRLGEACPLLIRFKDGQSFVLISTNSDGETPVVVLRDPMSLDEACITVDEVRLKSVWNGEALLLKRKYALSDAERPFGLVWLFGQIARERRIFRDIFTTAVLMSLFALMPPLVFMVIVDRVLVYQNISTLVVMMAGAVYVVFFDMAFGYMKRFLTAFVSAKIDARIGVYAFHKALGLPITYFERLPTGVITYRLNEIHRIRNFITGPLFNTVLDLVTMVILLPAMFYMSTSLTFFVLGIAFVMCLIVLAYIPAINRAYGRVIEAEQRKGSFMIETIHGMRTVKSLALEGLKRRDWDVVVAAAARANRDMLYLANQPQTFLQPLDKIIYLGTLAVGAYLAIGTDATVQAGTLVAFSMLSQRASQPFMQVATLLQQYQEVKGAVMMVSSVVNQEPEIVGTQKGVRPVIRGEIIFNEVRFRYPGAQSPALNKVSFSIKPGEVVGIMGRSGSGKTTITRLLQGLHSNYEGLIKVDGVDLREIDLYHLRSNFGVVLQDNFLFQGSIRDNITAALRAAKLEYVINAARMAGAEEFIERLPRGYETQIEEGSSNLSGGQRQRIAIARALLVNPPVLILDEATSALDPDSEAIINNNINRIGQGRTMIIISHRLASLVKCDQIMVLERGELYDMGKHEELLERCDVYRHLWFQQNRHLAAPGSTNERANFVPTAVS